jgi:hypothetical protein
MGDGARVPLTSGVGISNGERGGGVYGMRARDLTCW